MYENGLEKADSMNHYLECPVGIVMGCAAPLRTNSTWSFHNPSTLVPRVRKEEKGGEKNGKRPPPQLSSFLTGSRRKNYSTVGGLRSCPQSIEFTTVHSRKDAKTQLSRVPLCWEVRLENPIEFGPGR